MPLRNVASDSLPPTRTVMVGEAKLAPTPPAAPPPPPAPSERPFWFRCWLVLRALLFDLKLEHRLSYWTSLAYVFSQIVFAMMYPVRFVNWPVFASLVFALIGVRTAQMAINIDTLQRMKITRHVSCSHAIMMFASLSTFFLHFDGSVMVQVLAQYNSIVARYLSATLLVKLHIFCTNVKSHFDATSASSEERDSAVSFRRSPYYWMASLSLLVGVGGLAALQRASATEMDVSLHTFSAFLHFVLVVRCVLSFAGAWRHITASIRSGARAMLALLCAHAFLIELVALVRFFPRALQPAALADALLCLVIFTSMEFLDKPIWASFFIADEDQMQTLNGVLLSKKGFQSLNIYLRKSHAAESILFWSEVELFKDRVFGILVAHRALGHTTAVRRAERHEICKMLKKARKMHAKYIAAGASCEVNVSSAQKANTTAALQSLLERFELNTDESLLALAVGFGSNDHRVSGSGLGLSQFDVDHGEEGVADDIAERDDDEASFAFKCRRPPTIAEVRASVGDESWSEYERVFALFDVAQHEVFEMMKKDVFRRFCESDEYRALVHEFEHARHQQSHLQTLGAV